MNLAVVVFCVVDCILSSIPLQAHVRYKPVSAEDILGPLEDIDVDPKVKDAIVKAFLVFSKQQQEQGQQRQQAQEQGQQLSTRIDDLNRNVSQRMSDLREDANKVEQRFDKRFDQVDQRFKEVEQRFKEVEQRFDKRFDKLDNRFAELDKVLGRGLNVLYVLLVGFGSMAIKDVLPLISKLLL